MKKYCNRKQVAFQQIFHSLRSILAGLVSLTRSIVVYLS